MSQPTGEGAQSGATGAQGGTGDPTSQQQGGDPTGQQGDPGAQSGTQTPPPADATVSRADFDRLQAQLRAADQNRVKAENDLKQLRDKDLPEMDKLKRDNAELESRATKAEADLAEARISNAFLTANSHEWANPATALRLLDRSKIQIDPSTGDVSGVKDAAEALAKSDPYLLKPKSAEPGSGEPPKPGTIPGNNGGGSGQPTKEQLTKRFNVLGTRQ
jgi:hypothetical protein